MLDHELLLNPVKIQTSTLTTLTNTFSTIVKMNNVAYLIVIASKSRGHLY